MRIGILSGLTGASVRSLRHYEKAGLVRARRGGNGYRQFDPQAVIQVQQLRRMLGLGFSPQDIAAFPACMLAADDAPACPAAAAAHRRKLAQIESQIAELERRRVLLLRTLHKAAPP